MVAMIGGSDCRQFCEISGKFWGGAPPLPTMLLHYGERDGVPPPPPPPCFGEKIWIENLFDFHVVFNERC